MKKAGLMFPSLKVRYLICFFVQLIVQNLKIFSFSLRKLTKAENPLIRSTGTNIFLQEK